MSPRLIPWCLAATGFLAALTVFTRQGKLDDLGEPVPPPAALGHGILPPAPHQAFKSSPAPAVFDGSENVAPTLILPLPTVTQPEPHPDVQPVPDDEPTVEDLPARRGAPDSPDSE